jgi:dTDP-4-dehydrorhamnose reductase
VDKAEEDWKTAAMVNGLGTRNLAVSCAENGVELLHCSTDYVFYGKKGEPYTILDEPNPINRYGESKLLGERLLQSLGERFYLVRLRWVFGHGSQNFLFKLKQWAQRNR